MFLRSSDILSFLFRSDNFIYRSWREMQACDEISLFNPARWQNVNSVPNTPHVLVHTLSEPLPIDKMQGLRKSRSMCSSLNIARHHHKHHHSSSSTCSSSKTDSLLLIRELASLTKLGHDIIFEMTLNALNTVLTVGEEPSNAKKKSPRGGRRNHPNSQSQIKKSHSSRFYELNRTSFEPSPTTAPTTSPSTTTQRIVRFNPVVKIFYI